MDLEEQYDKLYRYCYFKLHNQHTAEDIAQESFLRFFKQTSYLDQGKSLAYLYTIAKNLCNDYFRKIKPESLEDMPSHKNVVEDLVISITLQQSLKVLPEETQEIILLKYVNNLSIGEISNITGLSRFVLYRRINSGLKILKTLLREEDFS